MEGWRETCRGGTYYCTVYRTGMRSGDMGGGNMDYAAYTLGDGRILRSKLRSRYGVSTTV